MTTKPKTPAKKPELPVLMTEEVWRETQLSIAARTGVIKLKDKIYKVVNREGKDLAECSLEAEQRGDNIAIPAGEPADLIRADFQPCYRALGRTGFLKVLADNAKLSSRKLLSLMRQTVRDAKQAEREAKKAASKTLKPSKTKKVK